MEFAFVQLICVFILIFLTTHNISYSLKKNRENQPKERFPSEPSQGNEDRQKVLAVLNEQLDRISGEEMRQLLEFLNQNEDRNIFQDLENNN